MLIDGKTRKITIEAVLSEELPAQAISPLLIMNAYLGMERWLQEQTDQPTVPLHVMVAEIQEMFGVTKLQTAYQGPAPKQGEVH